MQPSPPQHSPTGRRLGWRCFLRLGATGAGGCESSPDNSDIAPVAYPSAPGVDPKSYSESSGFGIWWKPDRARMDSAAELGAFLSNSENQQYVTATGSFPVRGALAEPYQDPILTFMQEGTKFAPDPLKAPYFAIGGVVADLVAEVLTGEPNASPIQAMDATAECGQQAVDSYWGGLGI